MSLGGTAAQLDLTSRSSPKGHCHRQLGRELGVREPRLCGLRSRQGGPRRPSNGSRRATNPRSRRRPLWRGWRCRRRRPLTRRTLGRVGAWGPGIFSNDTASEVRGDFREMLEDGLSAEEATTKLVQRWGPLLEDRDTATNFWTGLAAAQFELGRLLSHVRDTTVALIDAGGDLELWADTGPTGPREAALRKLKTQLLGPQKAPVKVRPPVKVFSPLEAGQFVGWKLPDGREIFLDVLWVQQWRGGSFPIVDVVDSQGRVYMHLDSFGTREPARFAVLEARQKDLPDPGHLRVVKRRTAPSEVRAKFSTGWGGLAIISQRLLDDPEARPRRRWRLLG